MLEMSTDKQTIDWYNHNADMYAAHVRAKDESIYHSLYEKPAMYALLPELAGKSVLSIGCGSGEDSQYLKDHGANKSVGVDISEKMIEIARNSHPDCEFTVMDMESLKFENESFDMAYSSLALHYIENLDSAMSEVWRVLKPGGYFIFSCDHPVNSALEISIDNGQEIIKKLEKHKDRVKGKHTITGDYLGKKKIVGPKDFAVNAWHRSLGDITAPVHDVGFLIEQIVEPRPLEKMKELSLNSYEKLIKIPEFIIFRLLKPL